MAKWRYVDTSIKWEYCFTCQFCGCHTYWPVGMWWGIVTHHKKKIYVCANCERIVTIVDS